MYSIIKNVILNHTYTDLNKLLAKIKRIWIEENITDEEYNQLINLTLNNIPVKNYDIQVQIDKLWAAIHKLESNSNNNSNNNQSNNEEPENSIDNIPEFIQPTGAHDAYQQNDMVTYNGAIYISLINGNVWAPDIYPAGWRLIRE